MRFDDAQLSALEEIAARAVPAAETLVIDGWLARRTSDLTTRRANSVLARAYGASVDIGASIAAVERFYAGHGLPARFQLTPASAPHDLAAQLTRRGYITDGETSVACCPISGLAGPTDGVQLTSTATSEWWRVWCESLTIAPARATAAGRLFARVTAPTAFAVAAIDGAPAAVGLGVHDGDWLGIFNMTTLPAMRGRGGARAVLHALARWAAGRDARTAYLQVEAGNDPARRLYDGLGFRQAYRYAYLTQPSPV